MFDAAITCDPEGFPRQVSVSGIVGACVFAVVTVWVAISLGARRSVRVLVILLGLALVIVSMIPRVPACSDIYPGDVYMAAELILFLEIVLAVVLGLKKLYIKLRQSR